MALKKIHERERETIEEQSREKTGNNRESERADRGIGNNGAHRTAQRQGGSGEGWNNGGEKEELRCAGSEQHAAMGNEARLVECGMEAGRAADGRKCCVRGGDELRRYC